MDFRIAWVKEDPVVFALMSQKRDRGAAVAQKLTATGKTAGLSTSVEMMLYC